ncbi:YncE family protein [Imperialibacter roseus]|uniref:YncE family protein n=1 Tax=Imperialibacter roseus TaxID=1324217 RepID=A0ABZ0ITW0_9BACT|nr:YncE family protein [Imperialibacter roseus]WOK08419.1 YncE family protein [Imperialibacter roseus]
MLRHLLLGFTIFTALHCQAQVERLLYVAQDQGFVYVYDINNGHKFLRKFEVPGTGEFKGISADPIRGKLYLSSYVGDQFVCVDLKTEKVDWSIPIIGYPDSQAITPDGKYIYLPKRHGGGWDVIDADQHKIVAYIKVPFGNPHNTWASLDGTKMYLAAMGNENLYVADVKTNKIIKTVGPFEANQEDPWSWTQKKHNGPKGIRPFAVSKDDKYCYINLDGVLGYEVGDISTGKRLGRVEVGDFESIRGNHLTTSHGVNITPDQKEIWVSNDAGPYVHIFDCTVWPHKRIADIKLNKKNGWISFSIDGKYGYPSSGDVIDTKTRKIVAELIESEKLVEVQFENGKAVRASAR